MNRHVLLQISNGFFFKLLPFVLSLYYIQKQRELWSLENTGLTSQTNPDLLIWVMYNFQVRNNLFYILYEASNLKTAGVCMARSQNSEKDDFKIMLKVQCSYFIIKLFYINLIKTSSFNKKFLKNFCYHPSKKQYHKNHRY